MPKLSDFDPEDISIETSDETKKPSGNLKLSDLNPDDFTIVEMSSPERGSMPPPAENVDTSGNSIGELRRRDEIVTNVKQLDNPVARENLELSERMLAFARPFMDTAIPGAGAPGRVVETRAIQSEYSKQGTPISLEEAQQIADRRQADREAAFPGPSMLGVGTGLMASGAMLGPVGGAGRTALGKTGSQIMAESGELLTMAGIGGLENVMFNIDNPDSSAFNDFLAGSILTGSLHGLYKLPAAGRAGIADLKKANEFIIGAEKARVNQTISTLEKEAAHLNNKTAQSKRIIDRVSSKLGDAEVELEVLRSARKQAEGIIREEAASPAGIHNLPKQLDDIYGGIETELGQLKAQQLNKIGSRIERVDKPYERTMSNLLKSKNYTGPAESARQDALRAMSAFEEGIDVTSLTQSADPILGTQGHEKIIRRASVAQLDKAKQQIQDLLYNKEWLATAPRDIRNSMVEFERSIRNIVSGADPTGDLRAFNNAIHGVKKARFEAGEMLDRTLFEKAARGEVDLPVVQGTFNDLYDYLDPIEDLQKRNSKVRSGFTKLSYEQPLVREKLLALKGQLRGTIDSNVNKYGSYQSAKKLSTDLLKEEDRLLKSINNQTSRLDSLGIGQDARQLAEERKLSKIAELQQQRDEMMALDFIPGAEKIKRFFKNKPIREAATKKAVQTQGLASRVPGFIKKPASLAARGASIQTPELLFDVPDENEE